MPEAIGSIVAEFGRHASPGSWFLAKVSEIEEQRELIPYSHYLRLGMERIGSWWRPMCGRAAPPFTFARLHISPRTKSVKATVLLGTRDSFRCSYLLRRTRSKFTAP